MRQIAQTITRFNCAISTVIWLPAWIKMVRSHASHDYALLSLLLILWLQASNLFVAIVEHSKSLKLYLMVNTATVALTCGMVWYYQR